MIRHQDAITLAIMKLRTKRLLMIMGVVASALLFGLLYAASTATTGLTSSLDGFTKEAFDGRYLVKSTALTPVDVHTILDWTRPSEELITELQALEAEYFAQQERIAEEHGLEFDEDNTERIIIKSPFPSSAEFPEAVNNKSPVWQLYITKKQADYVKSTQNTYAHLKGAAERYGATGLHELSYASLSYADTKYLSGGEEDLSKVGMGDTQGGHTLYSHAIHSVQNSAYTILDDRFIERYLFPENDRRRENTDAIPVVITAQEATELFGEAYGISSEPEDTGKIAGWMSELEEKLNGITYEACYRNSADIGRITEASKTLSAVSDGQGGSEEPRVVYDMPKEACGDLALRYDNRSAEEKTAELKRGEYLKATGSYTEPTRRLLKFQIVGLMYLSEETESARSVKALSSELLSMRLTGGAIIPGRMYDKLPAEERPDIILLGTGTKDVFREAGIGTYIVELPSLEAARSFMAENGCPTQDPCGKPFALEPYGSNYLLLDDFQETAGRFGGAAFVGALVIAGIIIFLTVGRVIISSRQETAVYRALGAKRADIIAIYTTYSLLLGLLTVVCAGIISLILVGISQILYAHDLTATAKITYGLFHSSNEVSLVGFDVPMLGLLTASIIALTIIASILPIFSNVRRSPIEDLRSE